MAILFRLLFAAVVVYLGVLVGLFVFQRRIVFRPETATPDIASLGVPGFEAIHIPAADHLALLAWYRPAAPGQPTLLYFHGNGGSLTDRIPRIRRYAQTGWGLMFVEYRGYGGQPGYPSEAGFAADALSAAEILAARGVTPDRLVLYGESLGTGVATRLATERPVAALILESPYSSIRAIAEASYPWLPVRWLVRDPFELLARIREVHAPLLVLQGGQDDIVPHSMGLAVFAAANEPKQLWSIPNAGHANLMEFGAGQVVLDFVRTHVAVAAISAASN